MLLNKIPVLDSGYVATIAASPSRTVYADMLDELFGSRDQVSLKTICHATLVFKAPIFVQMHLAQHKLNLVSARVSDNDAWLPNAGEIGSPSHDVNKDIADNISRTTAALLVNPSAYKADGADPFTSQVLLPLSTYAIFIISGTLDQWEKFYRFKSAPAPILGYANAVENLLKAEWKHA